MRAFIVSLAFTLAAGYSWFSSIQVADAQSSGFPSKPRFQKVTINNAVGDQLVICRSNGVVTEKCSTIYMGSNGTLNLALADDTGVGQTNVITIDRTANTSDSINLQSTSVRVNGTTIQSAAFQKAAYGSWTCSAASCTQYGQISNMSVARNSTGNYTVNFSAAGFTNFSPACTYTLANLVGFVQTIGATLTTETISVRDSTNTPADTGFRVVCLGT